MNGSGNDFILIDNRDQSLPVSNLHEFARKICAQKLSVGADGLIIVEKSDRADFRWLFFNADGSEAEMCGNGGRCVARFAYLKGIAPVRMSFETGAGIIDAEVNAKSVKLRLTDPDLIRINESVEVDGKMLAISSINTGVPHAVLFVENLDAFDVIGYGRSIRYHAHYQPAGTNVDFIRAVDRHTILVRTYERGVEGETLACGTGAVASALVCARIGEIASPATVVVRSGEPLKIYFEPTDKGFEKVYLEGGTKLVYKGSLEEEAYE
jgi:diaminopimelate epimerase